MLFDAFSRCQMSCDQGPIHKDHTPHVILFAKTLGDIVSDDRAELMVVGVIEAFNTALRTR